MGYAPREYDMSQEPSSKIDELNGRSISEAEAYKAMFLFLEKHYLRKKSDDIGYLLSGMSLLQDRSSVDGMMLDDWHDCVDRALRGEADSTVVFRFISAHDMRRHAVCNDP